MPNVVESYKLGNTKINFCDDFCRDATPESVNAILQRVMGVYVSHYSRAEQSKNGEQNHT